MRKRPDTTLEQVLDVRERLKRGESNKSIVEATGLSPGTICKIKDGWKPSGRKPVTLFPSTARRRGER